MNREDVRVGMQVRVTTPDNPRYDGQVATVVKVNPTNVKVELAGGRMLNAHPMFLTADLDAARAPHPAAGNLYQVALEDLPPAIGTLVVHTGNDVRIKGYHVVLGEGVSRGHTMVKIAKLGGDGNRYWKVPPRNLRTVTNFKVEEQA